MKILLIGCGKMGGAMLQGWLRSGISAQDITIVDPAAEKSNVQTFSTLSELPAQYKPELVVLAVKPQSLAEIMKNLARFNQAIFVSIIAGKTIHEISKEVPDSLVVRTMPNLASLIGKGIIGAVSSRKINRDEDSQINKILQPCGSVVWLENENMINSITAVTGSGPAYVFLFAKALADSAVKLGFSERQANRIVLEMIVGSAQLALEDKKLNLTQLKQAVTSKGGTTAAALEVLENNQIFQNLVDNAVTAAYAKALELAK